jgi:hypothetical protein
MIRIGNAASPGPRTQGNLTTLARSILIAPGLKSGSNLTQTGRHEGPGGPKDTTVIKEGDHVNGDKAIEADLAKAGKRRIIKPRPRKVEVNVIPLKSAQRVRRGTDSHFKAPDVHPQGKVRGGLPTKNQPRPTHKTLSNKSLSNHLRNEIRGEIHATIRLFRGMEGVVMELLPNVEVASIHTRFQTPGIGGRRREKEAGGKDKRIQAVLGKIPNNTNVIGPFLYRETGDDRPDWPGDNVTAHNQFSQLVVILLNDPRLVNRNLGEVETRWRHRGAVAPGTITGFQTPPGRPAPKEKATPVIPFPPC